VPVMLSLTTMSDMEFAAALGWPFSMEERRCVRGARQAHFDPVLESGATPGSAHMVHEASLNVSSRPVGHGHLCSVRNRAMQII
jgi:hypothetical protein